MPMTGLITGREDGRLFILLYVWSPGEDSDTKAPVTEYDLGGNLSDQKYQLVNGDEGSRIRPQERGKRALKVQE